MQIRKMRIKDLNRAEYNPRRTMTNRESADLRASIAENGYLEPIVVNIRDGRNVVVSGHQRLSAMEDMKTETADVSVVDLPVDSERELNIILNRVKGAWDGGKLADLLESIADRSHLGFTDREIEAILASAKGRVDHLFDRASKLRELERNCRCPHCGHEGNDSVFGAWHGKE